MQPHFWAAPGRGLNRILKLAVPMATTGNVLDIEDANVALMLEEAANRLEREGGELTLDLSRVRRLDSSSVRTLQKLATVADQKSVKLTLRGVHIDLYKTLKLMKLTHRFLFAD